jgi:hypothetical protein
MIRIQSSTLIKKGFMKRLLIMFLSFVFLGCAKTIEQPETSKDFIFKDLKVQLIKTDGLWKGVVHMKTTSSELREYDIELYFRNNDDKAYHYFWPVNVLPGEQVVNTTFCYQKKEFPNFPTTVECFEISNEEPPN